MTDDFGFTGMVSGRGGGEICLLSKTTETVTVTKLIFSLVFATSAKKDPA